jgi:hypothetical protein
LISKSFDLITRWRSNITRLLLKAFSSHSSSHTEGSALTDYITGYEYMNTDGRPALNSVQKIQPLKRSHKKSVPSYRTSKCRPGHTTS